MTTINCSNMVPKNCTLVVAFIPQNWIELSWIPTLSVCLNVKAACEQFVRVNWKLFVWWRKTMVSTALFVWRRHTQWHCINYITLWVLGKWVCLLFLIYDCGSINKESEHIGLLLSYLSVPETQSLCEINMDERTNMKRILCKNLELIRTRV